MSGGSWDYFYAQVQEVAGRLVNGGYPPRIALGKSLALYAEALRAIEWEDSGDTARGSSLPAIEKALGSSARDQFRSEACAKLEAMMEQARQFLDAEKARDA